MADETGISWTDATWNPWMGCTKVTEGCDNCYMFREQRQYGNDPEVVRRSKTKFYDPLKWREPRMIFTCSWSDWFHVSADPWRDEAWDVIRRSPQHTFQILTKRPGRIKRHLPEDWGDGYPNVWLGVTIETGKYEHVRRADILRSVPARVRFISAEPLLGSLFSALSPASVLSDIDWIIAGGESGPGFRPLDVEWVREIRDACQELGVAFHFKQYDGMRPKDKGKVLDGREWCEFLSPPPLEAQLALV